MARKKRVQLTITESGEVIQESPQLQEIIERFSTAEVADALRRASWEAHITDSLYELSARTLDDEPLIATIMLVHLPQTMIGHVSAKSHMVERTHEHIARNFTNSVMMNFTIHGDAAVYFKDGVRQLHPGNMLVISLDQPFVRVFAQGLKELVFIVPRPLFEEIVGVVDALSEGVDVFSFGGDLKGNSYATSLAELLVSVLSDQREGSLGEIEDTALDLLRGIYAQASKDGPVGQFKAVNSFIERHIRNNQLSAAMIAADLGVSERQLSRLLSSQGTTLTMTIRTKRLQLARRILNNPNSELMSVAAISAYCGFSTQSHFARCFKAEFGYSPTVARKPRDEVKPQIIEFSEL
ncbi:AraC-like DNA-binding protein [Aurantimicrobium minutum]|uniref:helix-turn-helix domain-containing protein n=1 Tax=Aurantimicrobium minutum TaxID=708131 RepID=UPI002473698F|nr:helix-turn-helix domain-containing protein [Aurantimicrobium minutum]MDH6532590.1 AraC-like DNA-binding protein [Aurantimicrobium minutum]